MVMHRLRHANWLDRIAVMQDNRLVEFDTPEMLLARASRFRELYTVSGQGA